MSLTFIPFNLRCSYCGSQILLSDELIEQIIKDHEQMNVETDEDRAIMEAIAQGNGRKPPLTRTLFPLGVEMSSISIATLGWCDTCKEKRISLISLKTLIHFLEYCERLFRGGQTQ